MALSKNTNDELIITRVFDAPRGLIWKAWTDPDLLKKWWGPKHFTSPASKVDLRVGGRYLNCMRGPDGRDYWSTGVYREVKTPERLAMTDLFSDEKGNPVPASHYDIPGDWPAELFVTVTFEDIGGKTRMTLTHAGVPETNNMRELCKQGWNEQFDKLVERIVPDDRTKIIAETGRQELVITRTYAAPRELVFKAYTDRNLIPQWWGPRRFTTIVDKMEAKPGGVWRYINRDATGTEYAFHGVYHDIVAPKRIVDTFEFEGMPGQVSLETCILESVNGRTRVTTRTVFQSVEDRDGMLSAGMEEGTIETLDRFAELLKRLPVERKAA